jgi:hypothetical protein
MSNIEAQILGNRLSLQDIFLFHVREQMKALGATSVVWHQNLSECRTYTEVYGPFVVIDGDVLLPHASSGSDSDLSDRYDIVKKEFRKVAKNQSFDKINRNEKGGIRIKEVELDVSGLLDILDATEGLEYAFRIENFVWVTLGSYFVEGTDLFCSFD